MSQKLSNRRVLYIAAPVVLSNVTVPILGAVDTGVIGQLGEAAPIGAVGIGAIFITSIFWIFGFLRMGTSGMVAQAVGAKDILESEALLLRAILFGAAAGLGVILLQAPFFWLCFKISPASAEVEELARAYMQIRIFSAPATIAVYGITGWLIAQERTGEMFLLQLFVNGINIVLDLLFVLQLGWGVEGVATASLIAETSGLVFGLWLVRDGITKRAWTNKDRLLDKTILRRMATVNSDIMLRSLLLEAAFISFLLFGSGFDDVTLAGNQVLIQFLHITAYGMDGFAFAAEALVGQAIGARDRQRLRRAVYLSSIWGLALGIALALAFALFGPWIIEVMAKSTQVQDSAKTYLIWMTLAPLAGCASWMLDGTFIGATRTKDMRNMMLVSVVIYAIAIALLLPPLGNHGLWIALLIFFIARGVTLGLRYPALERSAD